MKRLDYRKMCCGCGLCHSIKGVKFTVDDKGFPYPELNESIHPFCEKVCPSGRSSSNEQLHLLSDLWGKTIGVYRGWACDEDIRNRASSGGIITAICIYLLESKLVDGVIQTCQGEGIYDTKEVVSETAAEVINCAGSRYSISTPLYDLMDMLSPDKKYAFVGKPCDVSVLKMYMKQDESIRSRIPYTLSFFCAGKPSNNANKRLLSKLGTDLSTCKNLVYRGNGWPGYTKIINKDGTSKSLSYEQAWGGILGRDIRPFCRWCLDGIGLMADISCGDAWYIEEGIRPDFSEHEGRNVIFIRTEKGWDLIKKAFEDKRIYIENYKNYQKEMPIIQKYQFERKAFMYDFMFANKSWFKPTPDYSLHGLKKLRTFVPLKRRIKRLAGTYYRLFTKRI